VRGGGSGNVAVALAYGAVLAAAGCAFGPISGGHFNPAVTVALLAARRIAPGKAVFYVVSQLLGAALGAFFLALVYKGSAFASGPPFLGACDLDGVSYRAGCAIEAVLTFLLVTVVFATAVDEEGPGALAPVAIGLTVTLGVLWAGPLTGAAINPARAFGPAVASGHWANHSAYWLGPLIGALAAGLLYEYVFYKGK